MTKEIAPVDVAALRQSGGERTAPPTTLRIPLLRLIKSAKEGAAFFVHGKNNQKVQPEGEDFWENVGRDFYLNGSVWAIDIESFTKGWVKFNGKGKMPNKLERSFREPAPTREEAEDKFGKGKWDESYGFVLKCVFGPDAGLTVQYNAANAGMRLLYTDITNDVADRIEAGGGAAAYPCVRLGFQPYTNDYGANVSPKMDIIGWTTKDLDSLELASGDTKPLDVPAFGSKYELEDTESNGSDKEEEVKTTSRRRRPRD